MSIADQFADLSARVGQLGKRVPRYQYGFVTQTSPLQVQLEDRPDPVYIADSLVPGIGIGARVEVRQIGSRYDIVHAPSATSPVATPSGVIAMTASAAAPSGWMLCQGQAVSRATYADLFTAIGTTYGAGDGSTTFNLPNLKGRVPVGADSSDTTFDALGETGGEKSHTLTATEMPSHTHVQNSHGHTLTDPGHNHTQNSHNHTQNSHNHTQDSHRHVGLDTGGTTLGWLSSAVGAGSGAATVRPNPEAAVNTAYTTATNQATTATNQATTATNNSASTGVTLASATAVNQSTGGGASHNNLQPFMVVNYIIKS
ncbi:tail fiber protein [Demequina capsici]|uniref:Tail fiber protein n=1 Tax=Demequina capsici TaxID=3075620 RepID=A0AA96FDG0_9MICO|nr:tail fiber protein [Demequina sp. PMTSA13]WNM27559.1 tail fiber protein [Demequina sp. PMTSA13]